VSGGRLREAGDSAVLLELDARIDPEVNAQAIAIAGAVRAALITGVRDVVATYRSVAVYLDPLIASIEEVRDALESAHRHATPLPMRAPIEIAVAYGGDDGPDLRAVAEWARLSEAEVIARHTAPTYRVYMLGFQPGFAYMGTVDDHIAAPRHATPRLRVPAGGVGIAGAQTGIYPNDSPGGWQIIGRTAVRVFDPTRARPALLTPGDAVRFIHDPGARSSTTSTPASVVDTRHGAVAVTVLHPGLLTTVQDEGRWGYLQDGVTVCGAMDRLGHRRANAAVGNDRGAATLEVTLLGPQLRFERHATVAVAGADLAPLIDGRPLPLGAPIECPAGAVLRFAERRWGARGYIAFRGGLDVPPVLGSRSTHVASGLGGVEGRALRAGDVLAIGTDPPAPVVRRPPPARTPVRAGARLRIMPGPHDDLFMPAAIDSLQQGRFTITPQSNRMGYRLTGMRPLPRRDAAEMISEATFAGAVQVPPSGEPILLMADRQTAGGYPQLATVISADLPLAGQLAPGDWIEFELCSRAEAIAALAAQEAQLRGPA
jgi:KipI family sensor histidine kinase inhibitor